MPEILRAPLDSLVLTVKALGMASPAQVLASALDPPNAASVKASMDLLHSLGALTGPNSDLTALGKHMAGLPVDVRVAKMLIFACIFRCLDPILTVAAAMSEKSPLVTPQGKRDEANKAHAAFALGKSDHLTLVNVYNAWDQERSRGRDRAFCEGNYVANSTMWTIHKMRAKLASTLAAAGFSTGSRRHGQAPSSRVVKAVLCAGLLPNVAKVQHPSKTFIETTAGSFAKVNDDARAVKFYTEEDGRVFLHPSSCNFSVGAFEKPILVFGRKMKTSKVFLLDSSMVTPLSVLLFGAEPHVDHASSTISAGQDTWLKFNATPKEGAFINAIRSELDRLLAAKLERPDDSVFGEVPVLDAVINMLEKEM